MSKLKDITISVPRFLSFIDLGYLLEAARVSDEHFTSKVSETSDKNEIANLNATRQSLMRAVFISSYSMLEQNLDELVIMNQKKQGSLISPRDLRHSGIKRSLTYATKVLGNDLDLSKPHWNKLLILQEIRNHLVHYGPDFSESDEHKKRHSKFSRSEFVTVESSICFSLEQIEATFNLYMDCIRDFTK